MNLSAFHRPRASALPVQTRRLRLQTPRFHCTELLLQTASCLSIPCRSQLVSIITRSSCGYYLKPLGENTVVVARIILLGGLSFCASACAGLAIGPSGTGVLSSDAPVALGGTTGVRMHTSSDGPVFGAEYTLESAQGTARSRGAIDVGYASIPLPHQSTLGFEATIAGAVSRVPIPDLPAALGFGWRLALPMRMSPPRAPWEQKLYHESVHVIAPTVMLLHMFPVHGGQVQHELSMGLQYRFYAWPQVLP